MFGSTLTLYLVLLALVAISNTILLVAVFRAGRRLSRTLTTTITALRSPELKAQVLSVHSATETAVRATRVAQEQLQRTDRVLERSAQRYRFQLARVDVRTEQLAKRAQKPVELRDVVRLRGIGRAGAFVSGMTQVFSLVRRLRD